MSVPVRKTPYVLLGLMTLFTLGGPLVIFLTLKGGARSQWPPDRPIERWVFGGVVAAVIILMTACLWVGLANWRALTAASSQRGSRAQPDSPAVDESFKSD